MPSKLKKALGAVKDQTSISLAKVANGATGGGDLTTLEVAILKATSHDEEVPIDDRLVTEILGIISSKKSHAAACAAAIGRRIGRTRNWIVALKSLLLVLRIFQDGDPYFPREVLHAMKRGAKILNLSNFRDDSNSCPWDFTAFVRTFALYLDERLDCFLTGKLQRRYTNRDQTGRISTSSTTSSRSRFTPKNGIKSHEPAVRDMKPVMLLDKITYWQKLLDRAIATRPTGDAKSNKLIKMSLYAVTQESFDLYRDISDGLALLLDSFFHLQYQSCIQAFQACVRASKQFEELNGFYDLCKSIGVGRTSEYPSIQNISLELLETLQEFLKDQSSFPAGAGMYPSPNSLLLPPPPSSKDSAVSSSLDFGDSTIDTSERYSDYGSFHSTSLEDLMNRTDAGTPMSCHSEPYGGVRDDLNGNNFDTVSTKSLPNNPSVSASSLTFDLVSLDDVNNTAQAKDVEDKKTMKQDDSNSETFDPWEALMLRDDPKKEIETIPEEPSTFDDQRDSGNWLLALEETATQVQDTNSMAIIPFGLDDPMPAFETTMDLYNPFLVEPADPLAIAGAAAEPMTTFNTLAVTEFQPEPTFQVNVPDDFEPSSTPTFKATGVLAVKSDPFATFESFGFGETFSESGGVHQQSVLQEQQLWLQNQNKIIAKHLNSYNG
ncbi:Clathrin coat assembly protein [Cardamine amara subsp. amara]|uniref:Clathrin coat assembly protein n=1 Tax=Cardamine amara subsp. amara TaxID=228776 RepID=A0ABD1B0U3_CARAN